MEPYGTIDLIYEKLEAGAPVREIRRDIVALVENCLEQKRDTLDSWEKFHFLYAISALAWNRPSTPTPTHVWLSLCLNSIEKAFTPTDERDESYTKRDDAIQNVTYEQLIQTLQRAQ